MEAFFLQLMWFTVILIVLFFYFVLFLRWALTLSLKLKGNGMITAHCSLNLLGSSSSPTTASWVAATTGLCHHSQLLFKLWEEFHCVGQAGFKLLSSSKAPTLASQSAGIRGVSHHAQPYVIIFNQDLEIYFSKSPPWTTYTQINLGRESWLKARFLDLIKPMLSEFLSSTIEILECIL